VGIKSRNHSCDKLGIDLRVHRIIRCYACGRVLAIRVEAKAWIEGARNEVEKDEVIDFDSYEKLDLEWVQGLGTTRVVKLCRKCYDRFMDYLNQILKDLRSYVMEYGVANVSSIDKVIEFGSVEEMKRFIEDQVVWMSTPEARMTEINPGFKIYAISTTAMLKPAKDGKPLMALLYVPIERILEELKVV